MEEKEVNRQTGKWQYQDYSERYEKAGEMTFRELADWVLRLLCAAPFEGVHSTQLPIFGGAVPAPGDGLHHQDGQVYGPQLCGADVQGDGQRHGLPGHHAAQPAPRLCDLHAGAGSGPEGGVIPAGAQFHFHDSEPVYGCAGPLAGGGSGEVGAGVVWKNIGNFFAQNGIKSSLKQKLQGVNSKFAIEG